jgi:hypothetical protein
MYRNKYQEIIGKFMAVLAMLSLTFTTVPVYAASLTALSDTMSREKIGTASNHTIKYTTGTGVAAAGTMTITMPTGFTIGTVDNTDIDVSWGPSTGAENELTLAATASGTTWGAVFAGQILTITSGTGTITAASKVIVEIGTNATAGATGDQQITNHASAATYTISIGGTFGDTGKIAVVTIADDQIPVTAGVDPSFTFTVANTTLDLSTISTSAVSTTSFNNITIGTNAHNGYTVTVKNVGSGSNPGLYNSNDATLIASSTTTLAGGTEGYGGNCNKVSGSGACTFADGATQNVTGFTLAGSTFASYATKPAGTDTFQIRVKAAISSATEPGTYVDTLTLIGTANF